MLGPNATTDWHPWPDEHGAPPDWRAAQSLAHTHRSFVALLGSPVGRGPEGRYGLVGFPIQAFALTPQPGLIAELVDRRPPGQVRVLLLGYEMGAPDNHLPVQSSPRHQPAGMCFDLDAGLLVDHRKRRLAYWGAQEAALDLSRPREIAHGGHRASAGSRTCLVPTVSDQEHARRIMSCKHYISRGDIYQGNVTRRLRIEGTLDVPRSFMSLMHNNPTPHSALLQWNHDSRQFALLSNTMETLLTYNPSTMCAESLPIKGTRKHAGDPDTDLLSAAALASDPKERAEHVMIVDLVRNDLGRVCTPGSVHVPELMTIQRFSGVMHGISRVVGQLSPRHSPGELLAAVFPGGSITGTPKRRAMQLLQELEQEPRGFYTGSIVAIFPDGRISASILIRTAVLDAEGWSLNVGGAIVADSTPAREITETWEKMHVFSENLALASTD